MPKPPECDMNDEVRAHLQQAIEESERLGPSVIPDDAEWTYHAVPNAAAIACRTTDTAGRRVTCWIQLTVSASRDAIKDAAMIAQALATVRALQQQNQELQIRMAALDPIHQLRDTSVPK